MTINVIFPQQPPLVSFPPTGTQGPPGKGVPPGGLKGYVLTKASDADYDTVWAAPGSIPIVSEDITAEDGTPITTEGGDNITIEGAQSPSVFLLENGGDLLLENGNNLLLES